jgi:DNA-binding CsgD family transcriptional regulator
MVAAEGVMSAALALSNDVVWPPRVMVAPLVPLSPRERQVVALAARGQANKVIASDLGLRVSTVSVYLLKAARKLGVRGRVALISAYLVENEAEPRLPAALSPSERAVTVLVLQGASNAQIAALRGTSARTVANQIAGIFRKLRVNSRGELMARLTVTKARPPS